MAENDLDQQSPALQGQGGKHDTGKPDSTVKPANTGIPDRNGLLGGRIRIDRTQTAIIVCGLYLFFSLAGNIAATKVTYFGSLVMDAGFIYSLTFTWRDLIHKQLGKKAAITTIWLAAGLNLLAALYFQLVVLLPAQTDWANSGGQTAWAFLFGIIDTSGSGWQSIFSLQMRIVLGSILTAVAGRVDRYQSLSNLDARRPAKLAAVDAGLRLQCRFHTCGQPALSHHRFFGDSGKGRLAADDLDQYHRQGLDDPPGILDHLPGAGEADL